MKIRTNPQWPETGTLKQLMDSAARLSKRETGQLLDEIAVGEREGEEIFIAFVITTHTQAESDNVISLLKRNKFADLLGETEEIEDEDGHIEIRDATENNTPFDFLFLKSE